MADRYDKFTERARRVLIVAQEEANCFNHNYVGTEHILLALVREKEGLSTRVLVNLGVELNQLRSATEFIIGRGNYTVLGQIGLTPRAKIVIELSVAEAKRLGDNYIGTAHLLLGIISEGSGIAAGVLESLGINIDRARDELNRIRGNATAQIPAIQEPTPPPKSSPNTEDLTSLSDNEVSTRIVATLDEIDGIINCISEAATRLRALNEERNRRQPPLTESSGSS